MPQTVQLGPMSPSRVAQVLQLTTDVTSSMARVFIIYLWQSYV